MARNRNARRAAFTKPFAGRTSQNPCDTSPGRLPGASQSVDRRQIARAGPIVPRVAPDPLEMLYRP